MSRKSAREHDDPDIPAEVLRMEARAEEEILTFYEQTGEPIESEGHVWEHPLVAAVMAQMMTRIAELQFPPTPAVESEREHRLEAMRYAIDAFMGPLGEVGVAEALDAFDAHCPAPTELAAPREVADAASAHRFYSPNTARNTWERFERALDEYHRLTATDTTEGD